MPVLGCSGHQVIPATAHDQVVTGMRTEIARHGTTPLVGVSSLALGADQLFAAVILHAGGRLHVVVPCDGYASTFDEAARPGYETLLAAASRTEVLPFPAPSEEAFLAAGHRVVDLADVLLAVWDGRAPRGKGGTADVVAYAKQSGVEVEVIWPEGVDRAP